MSSRERLSRVDVNQIPYVTEDECSVETIRGDDGKLKDVFFGKAIDRLYAYENAEFDPETVEEDVIRQLLPTATVYSDASKGEYVLRVSGSRMIQIMRGGLSRA